MAKKNDNTLLIVGAAGFAAWWFFLRKPAATTTASTVQTSVNTQPVATVVQSPVNTAITAATSFLNNLINQNTTPSVSVNQPVYADNTIQTNPVDTSQLPVDYSGYVNPGYDSNNPNGLNYNQQSFNQLAGLGMI
jgi:Flp pilus assembly protein TadG